MRTLKVFQCLILIIISLISIIPLNVSRAYTKEKNYEDKYLIEDGYLYRFHDDSISIFDIRDYESIEELSYIYYPLSKVSFYLSGRRLFMSGICEENDESYLDISIYDIYDRSSPHKLSNFRLNAYDYVIKECNGVIYLCSQVDDVKISIISLDFNKEEPSLNKEEFEGGENNFMYLFDDSMYVICNEDMIDSHFTTIYKFHIEGDAFKYVNKISFDGSIINESFISEYNDNLRILVCCEDYKNKIYIFDKDLSSINSIDIILDNTNITNIYFDSDICYISSFMKDGYLHIYDLNYNNPKEVSKIKLSSSCDILYKICDDRILYIGNEYRVDTYKNSYSDKKYSILKNIGVKVNYIDISDINNPSLVDDYFIKGKDIYSKAFINSRYFIYSKDMNIIAFPLDRGNNTFDIDINSALEVYNGEGLSDYSFEGIYVFNLDNKDGIYLKFILDLEDKLLTCNNIEVIGESIFVFSENSMCILSIDGKIVSEYEFTKREASLNVSLF